MSAIVMLAVGCGLLATISAYVCWSYARVLLMQNGIQDLSDSLRVEAHAAEVADDPAIVYMLERLKDSLSIIDQLSIPVFIVSAMSRHNAVREMPEPLSSEARQIVSDHGTRFASMLSSYLVYGSAAGLVGCAIMASGG